MTKLFALTLIILFCFALVGQTLKTDEKIYHISVEGSAEFMEYQQNWAELQQQIEKLQNAQAFWKQKQQTIFALEGVPKSELGRRWELGPDKKLALYPAPKELAASPKP